MTVNLSEEMIIEVCSALRFVKKHYESHVRRFPSCSNFYNEKLEKITDALSTFGELLEEM